jgi:hypothetical protein
LKEERKGSKVKIYRKGTPKPACEPVSMFTGEIQYGVPPINCSIMRESKRGAQLMDKDGFSTVVKGPMTLLPLAPKSSPQPSAAAPVFSATPTLGGRKEV